LGIGTGAGRVIIYDLRYSHPLIIQNHKNGNKIIDIKFQKFIGEDVSALKVWKMIMNNLYNFNFWLVFS